MVLAQNKVLAVKMLKIRFTRYLGGKIKKTR